MKWSLHILGETFPGENVSEIVHLWEIENSRRPISGRRAVQTASSAFSSAFSSCVCLLRKWTQSSCSDLLYSDRRRRGKVKISSTITETKKLKLKVAFISWQNQACLSSSSSFYWQTSSLVFLSFIPNLMIINMIYVFSLKQQQNCLMFQVLDHLFFCRHRRRHRLSLRLLSRLLPSFRGDISMNPTKSIIITKSQIIVQDRHLLDHGHLNPLNLLRRRHHHRLSRLPFLLPSITWLWVRVPWVSHMPPKIGR